MNKDEKNELVNAIIDLHEEIKGMGQEIKGMMHQEIKDMRQDMNKQQAKTNHALGEMRLSYMRLDESFNKYARRNDDRAGNHETRIVRLEEKASGGGYIAREPAAKYKRKKK